jgi:hypothetical protein
LHQLAFPPLVYKGSFLPTSLPTPVVSGVFNDGYPNTKWYFYRENKMQCSIRCDHNSSLLKITITAFVDNLRDCPV